MYLTPPETETTPVAVAAAIAERDRVRKLARDANLAVRAAQAAVDDAQHADFGARKRALRSGQKPPKPTELAARVRLRDALEQAAALRDAEGDADRELQRACVEAGPAWLETVLAEHDELVRRAQEAQRALEQAVGAVVANRSTVEWLADPAKRDFSPGGAELRPGGGVGRIIPVKTVDPDLAAYLEQPARPGKPAVAEVIFSTRPATPYSEAA